MTIERHAASDFMEALLRAVLILTEHGEEFAGEIWIYSRAGGDSARRARWRIAPEPGGAPPGARIEIVYPQTPQET